VTWVCPGYSPAAHRCCYAPGPTPACGWCVLAEPIFRTAAAATAAATANGGAMYSRLDAAAYATACVLRHMRPPRRRTPSVRRVTAGSRRWWGPRLRLQTHMPTRHQPSCRGLQHRHSDTNKSATSKADPRHQQDWILKCLQGREAPPLAACGVATLCGDTLHGWTETLQGLVCRSPSSVTLERTCVVHVQWSSEDDGAEQMTYVRRVIASSGRTPPWPLSAVGRAIRGPSLLLPVTR
jgi:hypothetical protein